MKYFFSCRVQNNHMLVSSAYNIYRQMCAWCVLQGNTDNENHGLSSSVSEIEWNKPIVSLFSNFKSYATTVMQW